MSELGPELLSQGTFDDAEGWTLTGALSISSELLGWNAGSKTSASTQMAAMSKGTYRVTAVVADYVAADPEMDEQIYFEIDGYRSDPVTVAVGTLSATVTVSADQEGSESTFTIYNSSVASGSVMDMDNVSVKLEWEPGILTEVEDWAIATLIALNDDAGDPLFKNITQTAGVNSQATGEVACVDHWRGQIGTADGGIASFDNYTPFAFVKSGIARVRREGGYDANVRIMLDIAVGQSSRENGVCRIGDATHVGINRIYEKVFMAIDNQHPGEGFGCDTFYLVDVATIVQKNNQYAIQLHFEASWIPVTD